jgi:hypothetical protein
LTRGRATSKWPRAFCGALLALCVLALAACSYSTEFVIVNDSGSPVEVSYSFKNWRAGGECCPTRPAKRPLAKLDDADAGWGRLRPEEFRFDAAAGVVTVTLAPAEALLVERVSGYRGDRDLDDFFRLASVSMTGAEGTVYHEGRQVQYQFQRLDDNLYRLTYYGRGDKRDDRGR